MLQLLLSMYSRKKRLSLISKTPHLSERGRMEENSSTVSLQKKKDKADNNQGRRKTEDSKQSMKTSCSAKTEDQRDKSAYQQLLQEGVKQLINSWGGNMQQNSFHEPQSREENFQQYYNMSDRSKKKTTMFEEMQQKLPGCFIIYRNVI